MPAQLSDTPTSSMRSSAALHMDVEINVQNLKNTISNRLTEFLIEKELNPVLSYEDLQLDEVKKKNII
jgi:ATP:corrinoid adenosyltransferase